MELTPEEALGLIEDAKLSKFQYERIRIQAKASNADIFPAYKQLAPARKQCYPDNVHVTEKGVSIDLQSLIDHTVRRFFLDSSVRLPEIVESNVYPLTFLVKWGCDGSSDQSCYKQKFNDPTISDESIFTISMVPLEIRDPSTEAVYWSNPHPASTRYCRPLKLEFAKETMEKIVTEVRAIEEQINCLKPTSIEVERTLYEITVVMKLTMIDGKVCQALTGTPSAATCYICGARPSEMNNLDAVLIKESNTQNYELGLSTLHAWIRFMECLLHISYRLDFCKSAARTEAEKNSLKERKNLVYINFKNQIGLYVDVPRQGSGSSNDGNTARRFFRDPELTAKITGVDKNLVKRFGIILQTLSCGRDINISEFKSYCLETAELYVSLYGWYKMPATVHKILIHSADMIQRFNIAIASFSEECEEAQHKNIKRILQYGTRKSSRKDTNTDLIHKLLISSDPYIASFTKKWTYKIRNVDPECEKLLLQQ